MAYCRNEQLKDGRTWAVIRGHQHTLPSCKAQRISQLNPFVNRPEWLWVGGNGEIAGA